MTSLNEKIDLVITVQESESFDEEEALRRGLFMVQYPEKVSELVDGAIAVKKVLTSDYNGVDIRRALTKEALSKMTHEDIAQCVVKMTDRDLTPEIINEVARGEFEDDSEFLVAVPDYFFKIDDYLAMASAFEIIERISGYRVGRGDVSSWIWMVYKNKDFANDYIEKTNIYDIYSREVLEDGTLGEMEQVAKLVHARNAEQLEAVVKPLVGDKTYRYEANSITRKMLVERVEVEKETRYHI